MPDPRFDASNQKLSSSENAQQTGEKVLLSSMSNFNSPSAFGQKFSFSREIEMQNAQQQSTSTFIDASKAMNINCSSSKNAHPTGEKVLLGSMSNFNSPFAFGQKSPFSRGNEMQKAPQQSNSTLIDLSKAAMNRKHYSSKHAHPTGGRNMMLRSMSNFNSPFAFGQNSPSSMGNEMQNAQQQSYVSTLIDDSKKLKDEMQELGLKIKHHEDNIRYLRDLDKELEGEIVDGQVALGNYLATTSFPAIKKDDTYPGEAEEVIINHILKYEKTAAAFFCRMKYRSKMAEHSLIKDVIGVVAILGRTNDENLSSILSEYLGLETMLAVVCKTSEGVKALEAYNKDGSIDNNFGIHAFAANIIGIPLEGRFQVICLEDLRTYPGKFIADDPHRRLDLVKPILQGKTPTGFLGFAVNMVFIDKSNLYCMSKAGNTLRETLFYNLFSSLQVYRSREDMLKAQPVISNGAVSLDGGVIGKNGVFFMGHQKRDIDVKFPIGSSDSIRPEDYYETETRMKETKWKKTRTMEDLQREQELLDRAKYTFESKKKAYLDFLANGSLYATQVSSQR